MKLQFDKRQGGFSLIEIAIVLVIIGLLIGGVLKGQSMVKNSKIKRIATDTQASQGAISAYMDSYWVQPGDDNNTVDHWGNTALGGNRDGFIDGSLSSTQKLANNAATQETTLAWNHLVCENLIKGVCRGNTADAIVHPMNPVGGNTGIADGRVAALASAYMGLTKIMVCMGGIPADYAQVYDAQFDDGDGTTLDIRGSANDYAGAEGDAVPAAGTAYASGNKITICTAF